MVSTVILCLLLIIFTIILTVIASATTLFKYGAVVLVLMALYELVRYLRNKADEIGKKD